MHEITAHLFTVPIPLLEKIIRPIIIYAFLVILLRVFGKRGLAQLNPFDLVVLLMLSNTVQNAIIGDDTSLSGGILGAISLLLINHFTVRVMFDHPSVEQIVEGKSVVLIEHGKIKKERLKK